VTLLTAVLVHAGVGLSLDSKVCSLCIF